MRMKKVWMGTLCTMILGTMIAVVPAAAAPEFDPGYYAAAYPDVTAALGTDPAALLNHYLTFGKGEGRLPFEGAEPGAEVAVGDGQTPDQTSSQTPVQAEGQGPGETPGNAAEPAAASKFVPADQLANLSSLRKRMTDEELMQAYNVALELVTPYADLPREEQLMEIAVSLRDMYDSGMRYSMTDTHYNDPYGYFVLGAASCAGCTRATGMCLNILGIPYEHVNENQYLHQWCRVEVNGTYWICDAYGLYCGPEPAPYTHPRF